MGISLRRAARAPPAHPGAAADDRSPPRRASADGRRGAGASRSSCGRLLLAALVFALAGFQLVLPVDRLATVFVVDLSDSVGNAGREDALAFLRETLAERPERRRRRDRRVRQAGARRAAAVRPRGDRPPRLDPGQVRDRHRRARCASRPRSSPTTPRSGSSCSPTATTRPAAARPRPRSPRHRASGSRPAGSARATSTRCSIERLTTPSTARLGESVPVVVEVRSNGRPDRDGPPLRRRSAGRDPARRARGGLDHA